jgi:hypothetical protein
MEGDFLKATNFTAITYDDLENNIGIFYSTIIDIKTVSPSGKNGLLN